MKEVIHYDTVRELTPEEKLGKKFFIITNRGVGWASKRITMVGPHGRAEADSIAEKLLIEEGLESIITEAVAMCVTRVDLKPYEHDGALALMRRG